MPIFKVIETSVFRTAVRAPSVAGRGRPPLASRRAGAPRRGAAPSAVRGSASTATTISHESPGAANLARRPSNSADAPGVERPRDVWRDDGDHRPPSAGRPADDRRLGDVGALASNASSSAGLTFSPPLMITLTFSRPSMVVVVAVEVTVSPGGTSRRPAPAQSRRRRSSSRASASGRGPRPRPRAPVAATVGITRRSRGGAGVRERFVGVLAGAIAPSRSRPQRGSRHRACR